MTLITGFNMYSLKLAYICRVLESLQSSAIHIIVLKLYKDPLTSVGHTLFIIFYRSSSADSEKEYGR